MGDQNGRRRTRRGFLAAAAGAGAALAGCAGRIDVRTETDPAPADPVSTDDPSDGPGVATASTGAGGSAGPTGTAEPPGEASDYTRAYRSVAPSVTTVRVSTATGGGQGSGAIRDGRHVVTNQHVVAEAEHVSVVYSNGEYATAEVRGADPYADLAALRVPGGHPTDAPALSFAADDPAIGTEVIAVGTPLGVGESVSGGIVSGVDRSLPAPNNFTIADAIQTDAAANPGNSGGPLATLTGRPLGLVNSVRGNDITFAISGALMNEVVPALIEDGEYEHTFVGVSILGITPAVAEANGLATTRGVYVVRVLPDGPAAGALRGTDGERATAFGQQVPVGGDVILSVDGVDVADPGEFGSYLALETDPGDTIRLGVLRDGERTTARVTLGTRPAP
jgi:S1-C subfamily serine protease